MTCIPFWSTTCARFKQCDLYRRHGASLSGGNRRGPARNHSGVSFGSLGISVVEGNCGIFASRSEAKIPQLPSTTEIPNEPILWRIMKKRSILTVEVDDLGRFAIPADVGQRFGLTPGAKVRLEEEPGTFSFSRSSNQLARVYIEPTNICNLDCRTCIRNVWSEPLGKMTRETFSRIMEGVRACTPRPLVFFGGFGEPFAHPDILEFIQTAKQSGAEVELITNGMLLNEGVAQSLVEMGLNRLWVSIDGATPQSYADVRLGDALPLVIANLTRLQELRAQNEAHLPRLGIAFVAMQSNIADLPEVVRLGKRLGADQFSVTNVLPHTAELREQVLYAHSMYDSELQPSHWAPEVSLPRMDLDGPTLQRLADVMKGRSSLQLARQSLEWGANTCPFLEKGSVSIRWDGAVSPCLALLHTHTSYLAENQRTSHAYAVGKLDERSLMELWNDAGYVRLRERLLAFDFSPCTFCNSCEMAESNLEDCFGNEHPACGGCLWAQGFIQCP
jgi:MoaA/NifB/PqqE/SkfB family radical SAM enzyme